MLIREFCRATGLGRDTVRYYVRRGRLKPTVGSGGTNRYQVFDDAQVERARLIRAAQGFGFTLRQIAALGERYESGALAAPERARLLREHLAELDARAEQLRGMREYRAAKRAGVEAGETGPPPRLPRGEASPPGACG